MGQRISKEKIKREPGYLYFIDKQGYVSRTPMKRGRKKRGRKQRVSSFKITRAKGYLYYVDKAGYIARAKMARGRKKPCPGSKIRSKGRGRGLGTGRRRGPIGRR